MRQSSRKDNWFIGKTALVTGATSGIGRQIAKCLASYGCRVLPSGRDRQAMELLLAQLKDVSGPCPQFFLTDFSDIAAVKEMADEVDKNHRLDILVNNAGFGCIEDFPSMADETIEAMQSVNMASVVHLCRKFLPRMIGREGCGIMNVGSTASFFATPGSSLYGATKHFILGLTDALHQEMLSSGVHVTGVYPGHTQSRFAERATAGRIRQWHNFMSAESVARIALEGLRKNEIRVVPGSGNKMRVLAGAILPPSFILKKVHKTAAKLYAK